MRKEIHRDEIHHETELQDLRFALDFAEGIRPFAAVTDTLPLAEFFRRELLRKSRRVLIARGLDPGKKELCLRCPVLVGKDVTGRPLQGHKHAFFLPTDEDGDGRIDHVTVVAEQGFTDVEVRAIDRLRQVPHGEGEPLRLLLVGLGSERDLRSPLFGARARGSRPRRSWRAGIRSGAGPSGIGRRNTPRRRSSPGTCCARNWHDCASAGWTLPTWLLFNPWRGCAPAIPAAAVPALPDQGWRRRRPPAQRRLPHRLRRARAWAVVPGPFVPLWPRPIRPRRAARPGGIVVVNRPASGEVLKSPAREKSTASSLTIEP